MERIFIIILALMLSLPIFSQPEKKYIREGSKKYENKNYADAEISFRKALETENKSAIASYNLGNTLYKQGKFEEAANQFTSLQDANLSKSDLSKVYHNLGNSFLKSKKYQESIDAYKKSLKNNSKDDETKYNLSYAQSQLKAQPPQQKKQDQKDKNQDKNQDKKDQNKDKKDSDKNKQDKQQQNKDKQNDQNKDKQQQQQQAGKMSKEEAKRLLEAIQNDENNTQDKLKKEKAVSTQRSKPDVDW